MRLLFDQNLSPRLVGLLQDRYPGSTRVQEVGLARASDDELWAFAGTHGYVIVSKDSDFQERSVLSGFPPKVILIRRGNCTTDEVREILDKHGEDVHSLVQDAGTGVLILL